MFFRRPQYRRFDYEPRFYKPELDPGERLKRQLRAQRVRRDPARRTLLLVLLFSLAVCLYLLLSGGLR